MCGLLYRNKASKTQKYVYKCLCCVGLERGLEHHELICHVYNTWTTADEGRFYFRKDFSKYELFRNPTVSVNCAYLSAL